MPRLLPHCQQRGAGCLCSSTAAMHHHHGDPRRRKLKMVLQPLSEQDPFISGYAATFISPTHGQRVRPTKPAGEALELPSFQRNELVDVSPAFFFCCKMNVTQQFHLAARGKNTHLNEKLTFLKESQSSSVFKQVFSWFWLKTTVVFFGKKHWVLEHLCGRSNNRFSQQNTCNFSAPGQLTAYIRWCTPCWHSVTAAEVMGGTKHA